MNTYEIWTEGYLVTGMEGIAEEASLLGTSTGNTFKEACEKFLIENDYDMCFFNDRRISYWGCRLFDNETDARKNFG